MYHGIVLKFTACYIFENIQNKAFRSNITQSKALNSSRLSKLIKPLKGKASNQH